MNYLLLSVISIGVLISDGVLFWGPILMSYIDSGLKMHYMWKSLILGFFTGFLFLSSIVFKVLRKKLSLEAILKLASGLLALGYVIVALTSNEAMLLIGYSIIWGFSAGLIFFTALVIALECFEKPGLSSGIVAASSAVGSIFIPQVMYLLVPTFSWRIILGITAIIILSIVFIPFEATPCSRGEDVAHDEGTIDWIPFVFTLILNMLSHVVFFVPYIYVMEQVKHQSLYISFLGITQIPGRIASGILVDKGFTKALWLNVLGCLTAMFGFIGLIFSNTDGLIFFSTIWYSIGLSLIVPLLAVASTEVSTGKSIENCMIATSLARGVGCLIGSSMVGVSIQEIGYQSTYFLCMISLLFATAAGTVAACSTKDLEVAGYAVRPVPTIVRDVTERNIEGMIERNIEREPREVSHIELHPIQRNATDV